MPGASMRFDCCARFRPSPRSPSSIQRAASKRWFRRESEPYMTLAIAGAGREFGVVVAEVNLKLIADLVSSTKIGERGVAYVVDARDQVIAHPELSLIRRNVSTLA